MRGKFITLDGTDRAGHTTNIQFIQDWLLAKHLTFVATRAPGGTPLAAQIRELLLVPRDELVCNTAELLLMFAGRAQHINQVIEPNLNQGAWVLCDRFTDATYAYQGAGRNMSDRLIAELETIVQRSLRPDLTLILDIPVELGLKRASDRSEPDRFEQEKMAFFQAVRHGYLNIAQRDPERCVVMDASQPLIAVQESIQLALDAFWSTTRDAQ